MKKPIKYWIGKSILAYVDLGFGYKIYNHTLENWFNPQSGLYLEKIAANGSTVSRKWRELKGDFGDYIYCTPTLLHPREYEPKFNRKSNTWTLTPEFIEWLKTYVKRWEK